MPGGPQPPRRPISPWPVGAGALAVFVMLSIILDGSFTALQIMFMAALLVGVAVTWSRTKPRPAPNRSSPPGRTFDGSPGTSGAGPAEVPLPPVVKAVDLAVYLDVDVADVIAEIQAGHMPGNRLGRHWLIRREALVVWLDGTHSANRPS